MPLSSSSNSSLVFFLASLESHWTLDLDGGAASLWFTSLVPFLISFVASLIEDCYSSVGRHETLSISKFLGRTHLQRLRPKWAWAINVSLGFSIFWAPLLGPIRFIYLRPVYFCNEIMWACDLYLHLNRPLRVFFPSLWSKRRLRIISAIPPCSYPWMVDSAGDSAQLIPLYLSSSISRLILRNLLRSLQALQVPPVSVSKAALNLILENLSLMNFKLGVCSLILSFETRIVSYFSSIIEEDISSFSSLWERSFLPSSFKERILLPSCLLSLRDMSFPVVKPRILVWLLTVSLFCVEVLSRSEDALGITSSRPIGMDAFSKSQVAHVAVTIIQLTKDLVLRLELFSMTFKTSNILVDDLSNFYQFEYLSTCCFSFFASVVAGRPAHRVMSDCVYVCNLLSME